MTDSRSTEMTDEPMPLKEVAEQIVVHANKSDEHVIEAALLVRQTRGRGRGR